MNLVYETYKGKNLVLNFVNLSTVNRRPVFRDGMDRAFQKKKV